MAALPIAAQTASYPSAIATDTQLRKAVNNCQFTLSFPMANSDTSFQFSVVGSSCVVQNSIATIDNEKIAVCSVSGNVAQIGYSACPNIDGRGFDGTAAATHANGASGALNTDAWYHNSVKAEVEAVENTLGANLANVIALIPNPTPINKGGTGAATSAGALANLLSGNAQGTATNKVQMAGVNSGTAGVPLCNDSGGNVTTSGCNPLLPIGSQTQYLQISPNSGNESTYTWTASPPMVITDYQCFGSRLSGTCFSLSPSVTSSITAGVNATITLPYSPLGLNWNDSNHYVRILDSVAGNDNQALILSTGPGTCTSGLNSTCTLTIAGTSITLNHASGNWSIQTATAGIQEAGVMACASSTGVYVPGGAWPLYAPATIGTGCNVEVFGDGPESSRIVNQSASTDALDIPANAYGLASVHGLQFAPSATKTAGAELNISGTAFAYVRDVHFFNPYIGLELHAVNTSSVTDVSVENAAQYGAYVNCDSGACGGTMKGISINAGASGEDLVMVASSSGILTGWNNAGLTLQGGTVNLDIIQSGSGSVCCESVFSGVIIDSASQISVRALCGRGLGFCFGLTFNGIYGGPATANAEVFDIQTFEGVRLNNMMLAGNFANSQGVVLRGVREASIADSNIAATGANVYITTDASSNPCADVSVVGNTLGRSFGGTVISQYGILTTVAAHTRIFVGDNTVASTSADLNWGATGSNNIFGKNNFLDGTGKPACNSTLQGSQWFTPGALNTVALSELCVAFGSGSYAWTGTLRDTIGSPIAAASSIPLTDYVHHITGAGTLSTVTPPAGCSSVCRVTLISDGGFGWNNLGNIKKPSSQSPTAANGTLILTWDGSNWY